MRTPFVSLLLAMGGIASAQAPPTLAEYLSAHPEEGGLVVGGEGARAGAEGSGLARYGRKLAHVGGVAAVVPLTMVRFKESPTQPPNLYDGLPRDAKILYLMSTLDRGQWATAAGRGVGLSDLRGEQRSVFLSLLPRRPRWQEVRVNADRGWGPIVGHGELGERERTGMRLRIERTLQIDLRIQGPREASTGASPFTELGQPGSIVKTRDTREDDATEESYGVTLRSVVPNAPKKGQLDASILNATVALPARTTVGEALRLLGSATGREILADVRVRGLSVACPGGPARAGDLLDALALSVAGSYRRVDGRFLLVSDVVGAGTRGLRLMLWKAEIDAEVERRKSQWTAGLAKTGLALTADYPDDPALAATPEVRRRLEAGKKDPLKVDWFSTSELSPEQRGFVEREIARDKDVAIEPGRVAVSSSLRYRFVLPDGTALQTEGLLGLTDNFTPEGAPPTDGSRSPRTEGDDPRGRGASARAAPHDDGGGAAGGRVGAGVRLHGALGGDRPKGGIGRGGEGRTADAAFRAPWAIPGARADSDATVLGETGRAVAARQATDPLWSALATEMRQQGYPRLGPRLADGDLMSPFDPAWPARCNAIAALASTPGLAGVIVAEATPRGYEEKDQPAATGGYSRLLQEAWGFGYDERARLAFFGQAGYDPVDLTTEALDTDLELDTPTFPRYPKPPLALVREAYDLWTTFRAKASAAALSGLRDALGEVPVLAEVRRTYGWQPPLGDATLAPWARGEVPPAYDDQRVPALPGAMGLVSAPDPRMRDALAEFGTAMRVLAPLAKLPHAFDLTRVLSARWEEFVSQGLRRR